LTPATTPGNLTPAIGCYLAPSVRSIVVICPEAPHMPNGYGRNWTRLRAAIAGFYVRHGRWPNQIRMFPGCIDDLRLHEFTEESFWALHERIALMADPEGSFIASSEDGATFNYGLEGMIPGWYGVDVVGWLGVQPDRHGGPAGR
jgi:hypothetical protein